MTPLAPWDADVVARTVWGEVRNQSPRSWDGVTWSIKNRLLLPRKYGATAQEVCLRPGQYDCWHPGAPYSAGWQDWIATITASGAVFDALRAVVAEAWASSGPDPVDGATHYYSDGIPAPYWVPVSVFAAKIDKQNFYKGVP